MARAAVVNNFVRRINSKAFTLLELILALSLSVVVVLTITMAVNLYWKQFNIRRTNVEEAQLARALLRHMADDLRSAMVYTPADLSGLQTVSQNSASGSAIANAALSSALNGNAGTNTTGGNNGNNSGASTSNGQPNPSSPSTPQNGTGPGGSTGGTGTASGNGGQNQNQNQGTNQAQSGSGGSAGPVGGLAGSANSEVADEQTAATVGLYGSATELRIDVSRLPRVDQYESLMSPQIGGGPVDIPSDVKTVTYFLRSESSAAMADTPISSMTPTESSPTGRGRGLMRREIDRATATWSQGTSGGSGVESDNARLLAEEVVGMTFQYFDGSQWLTDWDSGTNGGLPLAVEIMIVMADTNAENNESVIQTAASTDSPTQPLERSYRLVVDLPTATLLQSGSAVGEDPTALPNGAQP